MSPINAQILAIDGMSPVKEVCGFDFNMMQGTGAGQKDNL
jgi:hypothetical protein